MNGGGRYPVNDIVQRLKRLLIPYFVYGVLYSVFYFLAGTRYSIFELVTGILFGTVSAQLYYIFVLSYFTLLAPLLIRNIRNHALGIVIPLLSAGLIGLGYFFYINEYFELNFFIRYSPVWLIFYFLGLLFHSKKPELKISNVWLLIVSTFTLVLQIIGTALWNFDFDKGFGSIRYSSFLFAFCLVLVIYKNENCLVPTNIITRVLKYIGDNSFALYFGHIAFLAIIQKVFSILNLDFIYPLNALLCCIITICMNLVAMKIVKLVFKEKMAKVLFAV